MLTTLRIENVAVIQKAEIQFTDGFCVLTGETGAGKSILIDSLTMVLGGRSSRDMVRQGSEKAVVSAVFEGCSSKVAALADELGFPMEDDSLLLHRTLTADGRSTCRINGYPANTAVMRQLAVQLINIHGQQDNHALLDSATHGGFVDSLLADRTLVSRYQTAYERYTSLQATLQGMVMAEDEKARRMDMLRFQVEELTAANLQPGETAQLTARKKIAANSEKIAAALSGALSLLGGDDMNAGGVDLVQQAAGQLTECSSFLAMDGLDERLTSLGYEIQSAYEEIRDLSEDLVFDPRELAEIEERLDVLYRLSRKYGQTEEEMLAFLERAQEELEQLESSEENCRQMELEIKAAKQEADQLADQLSHARQETAKHLDAAICEELSYLNMPGVAFITRFTPCQLYSGGSERIEFLISANPGEPPKPLSKIASGGELSRIMLAIISVLTGKDSVDTLIFDEIDAGISGRAARKVGQRLKKTAQHHQVICITHLAQIAAMADTHYLIEKQVTDGRASTVVTPVSGDARLEELARIIGGETVTPASLQTARELIDQTNP